MLHLAINHTSTPLHAYDMSDSYIYECITSVVAISLLMLHVHSFHLQQIHD